MKSYLSLYLEVIEETHCSQVFCFVLFFFLVINLSFHWRNNKKKVDEIVDYEFDDDSADDDDDEDDGQS